MGRCWTWYASMVGSTRPIPLSRGAGVWCISSQATTTYHCWGLLSVRKMPLGKYVDAIRGGAECEVHQLVQRLAPDCVPLFLTDGFKAISQKEFPYSG